jgi:hypothetical protein
MLSTYPPGIFKDIFILFISFLSILFFLDPGQTIPGKPLRPAVWETPKVQLGNTTGYCGNYHKFLWEIPQ